MPNRRQFIAAATGALGMSVSGRPYADDSDVADEMTAGPQDKSQHGLDILILGGTGFIGPHMVRRALERGHRVTLFKRGRSNSGLFPEVETLIGDRDGQLQALEGRRWDAIIDNSGYVPRHVRDSASLLSGAAEQYLFISSISAYGSFEGPVIAEDRTLATMDDPSTEAVTNETYGPMKALCEQAVSESFEGQVTIVRPGFIVGPGDNTDRCAIL